MGQCNCYDVRQETVYTGATSYSHPYGVCLGTKEVDRCNCGGDESKCKFYPEKRKAAEKKMNTAEMWLKAQEDGKTYISEPQTLCYSKQRGLFHVTDLTSYNNLCIFNNTTVDEFLSLRWQEMQQEIMTKLEAETKFGIRIVD